MENNEMEKVKLETEELDPVAGGADLPSHLAYDEYWDELDKLSPTGHQKYQDLTKAQKRKLKDLLEAAKNEEEFLKEWNSENPSMSYLESIVEEAKENGWV